MKFSFVIILLFCGGVALAQNGAMLARYNILSDSIESNMENKPNVALTLAMQQLELATALGHDSLLYATNNRKAQALSHLGIFDEALAIQYKCLALAEKTKRNKFEAYYNIGAVYFAMSDSKNAIQFFERAKQEAIIKKNYLDTVKANLEIGLNYVGIEKSKEGIAIIERNLQAAKNANDEELLMVGYDDLSNAYYSTGDVSNAFKCQLSAFQAKPYATLSVGEKMSTYQHLAMMCIEMKNWWKAQYYTDSSTYYAKLHNSNFWLYECYRDQANIDEANGNFESALRNHQLYVLTKDSVYQQQYDTKMAAMNTLYELDLKQKKIALLALEKEAQKNKIYKLYAALTFFILCTIIALLLIGRRNQKHKQKMQQHFATQLLAAQEAERQRIAKELHDSVGQNILFIKNQVQKIFANDNPVLVQSVDNALQEVRSISKDLYPNQLDQYGLVAAVDALCEQVKLSSNIFISSDIRLQDAELNKDVKINCYRIIQESVSNILKHAKASAVRITAEIENNLLQLVIQDNGIGFDQATREKAISKSFGLLNLEERTRLMNGKFFIDSSVGNGTKLLFTIPV